MVINGIDTKDISVVVQGAIDKEITPLCLESIRKYLPGSEIILSTWKGSKVDGLDFDQVLLNDDPGGFDYWNTEYTIIGNTDRQVYSTMQGLRIASKKYAVKIRTDFVFESAGFLKWFNRYPTRNKKFSFLSGKVICCDAFSRDPRYQYRLKFLRLVLQPADFFFFGYTKDLSDLFDIPLMTPEEQVWFAKNKEDPVIGLPSFPPEEYLWVKFLQKHLEDPSILPNDSEEITPDLIKLTEATFAANLIILSHEQIGIQCGKSALRAKLNEFKGNCYTHTSWIALYRFYCKRLPLFYLVYRFKHFIINLFEGAEYYAADALKKLAGNRLSNFVKSFFHSIKGALSEEDKHILKPFYTRMRAAYLKAKKIVKRQKNYVKCFLAEDVTDSNLSVMVQGPVRDTTAECLKSIRKFLPNAELIFSTWEGSNTVGLDYDVLVLSKDPGSCVLTRRYPQVQVSAVNRIIVSSLAGIKRATRRYCLRLRSDALLVSANFLSYYNRFSVYIGNDAIVSRRIMVEGLLTAKDLLFDVADWWHLGTTEDLRRLFDIPLYPDEPEPYFEKKEHFKDKPSFADLPSQYIAEQYFIYKFIKINGGVSAKSLNFTHTFDNKQECIEAYRKFVADNLVCIEMDKSGVLLPKSLNVSNPAQYCGTMPGGAWLDLCHEHGTIPNYIKDRELTENTIKQQQEFDTNPMYYSVANSANTVKNYAAFKDNTSFRGMRGKIDPTDITFVVSGDIILDGDLNTHHCLVSIRRFFPKSRIILSTWDDKPLERLKGLYDQLVLLQKPAEDAGGRIRSDVLKERHPFNMEQRCVHAGMKEVRTKYAVRMRPDFYLFNDHFLPFYIKWSAALSQREASYAIFRQRVLSLKLFTYDPRCGYSYSLSSHFQFGLTEDLLLLWDGHQEMLGSLTYFERQPAYKPENPAGVSHRYMAEQYFLLNVVQKAKPKLPYPQYYFDRSDDRFAFETEKIYASNVLIGNNSQLGIASGFDDRNEAGVYTLERLLEIYLYNVEPDNQQCLDHLKEAYRPQEVKKSWKDSFVLLPFRLLLLFVKTVLRAAYRGVKAVLRIILPGYRTAHGVRDRLIAQEQAEQTRYDHLISRINQLEQALAQKDVQHASVGSKRRPKRRRLH